MRYLSRRTGIKFYSVREKQIKVSADEIHISYGIQKPNCDHYIPASGFLYSHEIDHNLDPKCAHVDGVPYLFPISTEGSFKFDIFSAIFYCLSRHEEYGDFKKDKHDRFCGLQSHAAKHNYIHLPIVDRYVEFFKKIIAQKLPLFQFPKEQFNIQPTIDIDHAYAFINKTKSRTILSGAKNIAKAEFSVLKSKQKVFSKEVRDPYDTYEFLKEQLLKEELLRPVFFILMSNESSFDSSNKLNSNKFISLVQKLQKHYKIGIHPSYHSHLQIENALAEKNKLQSYIKQNIDLSRQHFLKLSFPNTYRSLIQLGIQKDYSMGYHDVIGFRGGTCFPFKWYDLKKDEETELEIVPFQVMDVTLKQYMNLTPEEAIKSVQKIKQQVSAHNGTFQFIWHNSSFAEQEGWLGWDKVFKELIQKN